MPAPSGDPTVRHWALDDAPHATCSVFEEWNTPQFGRTPEFGSPERGLSVTVLPEVREMVGSVAEVPCVVNFCDGAYPRFPMGIRGDQSLERLGPMLEYRPKPVPLRTTDLPCLVAHTKDRRGNNFVVRWARRLR